ncbi:hypothetical protein AYO38_06440 [bacterium SCGC AG-212-C10]|nr:hypothetical protein AYO38_06440 [bacterium SCGC AG-212-C10]
MSSGTLRVLAICGLASQAAYFLAWFIAQFFEHDEYSLMRDYTSDLGALTAAHPLPYNIGTCLSGLLSFVFAFALYSLFRDRRSGVVGAALVGVFGFGMFLDGLLREDCAPRMAACKALEESQGFSWHHQAHDIETLFTFSALMVAPFVFAAVFRHYAAWQDLSRLSLVAGIALVVVFVPFTVVALQESQPAAGLLERLAVIIGPAWLAVVAWRTYQLSSEDAESQSSTPRAGKVRLA